MTHAKNAGSTHETREAVAHRVEISIIHEPIILRELLNFWKLDALGLAFELLGRKVNGGDPEDIERALHDGCDGGGAHDSLSIFNLAQHQTGLSKNK